MGRNVISLSGKVFGNLTVIKDTGKRINRKPVWECKCSCGNTKDIRGDSLISGLTLSCGCLQGHVLIKTNNTITIKSTKKQQAVISPALVPIKLTKLQTFQQSFSNAIPNVNFTTINLKNNSTALVDNSSMSAILYIEPSIYNQEYLVNNKFCSNYAECKKYIMSIVLDLQKLLYRVVVVYENEWQDKQHKIINFIKSVLKQNKITIFARKCVVRAISKQEANDFLEIEHIQGPARISHSFYGLYDVNNTLLACITFGKHHRQQSIWNKPTVAVLDRLAIKHDYNIPGGSSKLLSFAMNDLKIRGFNQIVSWSDSRISNGNLYLKLGFTLFQDLMPDYSYYCEPESLAANKCIMRGKQANKKSNLPGILVGQTELEYCRDKIRHFRVYDMGKKVWFTGI